MAAVFDARICSLGEGPLWHPEREELLWFDINACKLLSETGAEWQFDGHVSAAGWVDKNRVLVAGELALVLFDLESGAGEPICALEAEEPLTRPNDGRADPYGGFWIGTMGKAGEAGLGAIYRYFRGELRQLYAPLSVPNAICFSPDGAFAYWTDTRVGKLMRQELDSRHGWPVGAPEVFIDIAAEGWRPDGAVVDMAGHIWNAQYGGRRVAVYGPDGCFLRAHDIPAVNTTCPAFGGPKLDRLFCTSATQRLDSAALAEYPDNGKTFVIEKLGPGQREHQVVL